MPDLRRSHILLSVYLSVRSLKYIFLQFMTIFVRFVTIFVRYGIEGCGVNPSTIFRSYGVNKGSKRRKRL